MLLLLAFLQAPPEVPKPGNNDPLDLQSWSEVIIYILLPVLFIILYFVWRNRKNRNRKGKS
ncbi:adenylosuccinate synthetase [Galbibacter mesophilus]|uniref:adenylosuccinate synthetase n=1 Tax=Galbibacter mesophilus TaxID=379069 RepID=UPI00191F8856|nr:adenylosuccinate synthetase [Galbibacter mesophilus]MCM5663187.1 adenylosuccinate synthetase [Galbibacter mesophilus]